MVESPDEAGPDEEVPSGEGSDCDLATLYEQNLDRMYRHALMLLASHGDAEDAVHQVFSKMAGLDGATCSFESSGAYLHRAVRNECFRIMARRKRRWNWTVGNEMEPLLEAMPEKTGLAMDEQRRIIEDALKQLPHEQREVIHLKIYEQMTFRQISESVDVSINTVASRYRYAIKRLQTLLGEP
jgi:RNA polymerase sigma-70 factor (ECF subfamily)